MRLSMFYSTLLLTGVNLLLRLVATSFQVYISGRIGATGVGLLQLVLSVAMLAETAGIAGVRTAAMYLSAGVGAVIGEYASIAGASGGCQAEIGSASAMAAAGLCFLQGGTNAMIANAAALALKNMLGLACDPVCGLVEVPCVKRNVAGAVNAVSAAQLSLAGIKSAIPVDEVIDAMRRIGNEMSPNIKETGQGGLATTPTAIQIGKSL